MIFLSFDFRLILWRAIMRNITIFCILTFIFSTAVFSQEKTDAVKYMETMVQSPNMIKKDTWEYIKTFAHGKDYKATNKKRETLLQTINNAIVTTQKIPAFNESTEYRDAVLTYLKNLNAIMNQDYAKLADMEKIAEKSYNNMEEYFIAREKANDKLEAALAELSIAEGKFAVENNINLITHKDEITEKIEISAKVSDYYDDIYLIFFKSYTQELFLLDAMSKNDLLLIEKIRVLLIAYSSEGVAALNKIAPYGNDTSLKIACAQMLEFYLYESQKSMPVIIDYLQKNQSFMQAKTAYERKSDDLRTKEDVDNYNDCVFDLNEAVKSYNATNQELNAKRSELINRWNTTTAVFFDIHVPK